MSNTYFYTLDNIKKYKAEYNVIYGERSNGKTTAVLREILQRYIDSNHKEQGALIRRWEEDFKGAKGSEMFNGIINLGWIPQMTKGEYNNVTYFSQKWYLSFYDKKGNKVKQDSTPFMHAFALGMDEHYKSVPYPYITTILFDEFITRGYYLPDEFIKFQNLLSTIIRLRDNVTIYMCGNTVNQYCLYFQEMGLVNVKKQKKGTIDIYTYGEDDELTVAVEYSDYKAKKKASNKYFAFNNPKLAMIKNGAWEIDIYPHLPYKYRPMDVVFSYFIEFDGEKFECVVINHDSDIWTFIHRKTTDITETEYPVYTQKIMPNYNYSTNIFKPRCLVEKVILQQFKDKKIFYQDNLVGETIRNFLMYCQKNK